MREEGIEPSFSVESGRRSTSELHARHFSTRLGVVVELDLAPPTTRVSLEPGDEFPSAAKTQPRLCAPLMTRRRMKYSRAC